MRFLFAIISSVIFAVSVQSANITLDIINLDKTGTNNRVRYAYPGIKYEIPVGVEGGLYPFEYELTAAPSGMTISDSGIIEWDNPTAVGSPHTVTVLVTDAESNTDSSSISLTVTDSTSRFVFVNGSYSGTETGSITQPYSDLENVWAGISGSEILYFRVGIYTLPHSVAVTERRDSYRVRVGPDATYPAPNAFLAYPGETVTIDMEKDSGAATYKGYNFTINNQPDIFFGGLIITDAWSYAISAQSSADYLTVYNCDFRNIEAESPFDGNFSYLNYMNADHDYNLIHSNEFGTNSTYTAPEGVSHVKMYTTANFVFQDNTFTDLTDLDLKDSTDYTSIRHNTFDGAALQAMGYTAYSVRTDASFNFFTGSDLSIYLATGRDVTNFWFYRNTLYNSYVYLRYVESDDSLYLDDNVIAYDQADTGDTTSNDYWRNRGRYYYSPNAHNSYATWTGGLYGNLSDNIINPSGDLQGSYRDTYLGVAGWETDVPITPNVSGVTISGGTIQ